MFYSRCKKIAIVLVVATLIIPVYAQEDTALKLKSITQRVYCSCGCYYVLDACDCETALQMISEINDKLEAGESTDRVLMYFASVYGSQILIGSSQGSQVNMKASNSSQSENGVQNFSLPFQILGFLGAIYISYKLGQMSGFSSGREEKDGRDGRKKEESVGEWNLHRKT
jgi:hypothetical protein